MGLDTHEEERERAEFHMRDELDVMSLDDTIRWCEERMKAEKKVDWKKEGF